MKNVRSARLLARHPLQVPQHQDLPISETCAVLGLEVSTMKTRLHRARNQLRIELYRSERGSMGRGKH